MTRQGRILWETALALNRAAAAVSPAAAALPALLFFTDPQRTPEPWTIAARLPAGAGVVFRAFAAADRLDQARRLRAATRRAGVRLLVGLDRELAAACEADGVHLPERAAGEAGALKAARPDWIVTVAAHSRTALVAAARAGASAAVVSPVFAPGGDSAGAPLGPERFGEIVAGADLPVYALGGITADSAGRITGSGACGLCAVEGIVQAFGPGIRT